ncbi:methylamine utilization protein [Undibacterium sp. RTI2.1]|uniref:methylamine utilization protein n=1 Tax=unclassified Undibacterium TaxID=2630295 RepID=UPI002B22C6BC|nr:MULTISPECIES: methylamine utilization protein [unclassified Undibacterium]MEB0033021.1 methylamine utilization protein [Undibacterium sp. RTI2.1]MEB0118519.1 methylamine utilization protein [Undibacterium sp. RTI2.2]
MLDNFKRSQLTTMAIGLLSCACVLPAHADHIIQVIDSAGKPVLDAVVYFDNGTIEKTKSAKVDIEQKDKKFIPLVTVVQTGTAISFPNNDTVRHQAYSFSPAKPFELKLYAGKPEAPITFDKPGTVVVGCNIHDQMLAYIQIVDTPYFAKTDASGKAKITTLPAGKYSLKTSYYQQMANSPISEQAVVIKDDNSALVVKLNYKVN